MKPDLDAIRARCEAATPGPWELHDSGDSWRVYAQDEIVFDDGSAAGEYCTKCTVPDRDFFMAARTDIPALLAYIETLKGQIAAQSVGRWAPGEIEWANRIAHAEARFVEEYDMRKAAERQVEELKARIVTLEAMKP